MALQIGSTAPTAAIGADGDYFLLIDASGNKFFCGPKVSGAWPSTYTATVGPCGPALLVTKGAPASTVGGQGQGCVDMSTGNTYLKSNTGWSGVLGNILGPQGAAGPNGQSVPPLNSTSVSVGPQFCNANSIALSATRQNIPAPGGTQVGYFVPTNTTVMVGAMMVLSSTNTPGATTFTLVDATQGVDLYSYTISSYGTVANQTGLNVSLVTGNSHVWQVTGSGSAFVQVIPSFQSPSTQPMGLSWGPIIGNTLSTAPTVYTPLPVVPNSTITAYVPMLKTGFLYAASFINTAASNATFGLYNSAGTSIFSQAIGSGQTSPATVGPFGPAVAAIPAGYYTWRVLCQSPGYFSVQAQVFM